jgi:hypothetical protein
MSSGDSKQNPFKGILRFVNMRKSHWGIRWVWCMFQLYYFYSGQKILYWKCCVGKCIVMIQNPLVWLLWQTSCINMPNLEGRKNAWLTVFREEMCLGNLLLHTRKKENVYDCWFWHSLFLSEITFLEQSIITSNVLFPLKMTHFSNITAKSLQ